MHMYGRLHTIILFVKCANEFKDKTKQMWADAKDISPKHSITVVWSY